MKKYLCFMVMIAWSMTAYSEVSDQYIKVSISSYPASIGLGENAQFIDEITWNFGGAPSKPEDASENATFTFCDMVFTWDFGPNATPPTKTETVHANSFFKGSVIPADVVFNALGPQVVTLTYSAHPTNPCFVDPEPISVFSDSVTIDVVDNRIPTLSEWGVIILGLSLLILGLIAVRNLEQKTVYNS